MIGKSKRHKTFDKYNKLYKYLNCLYGKQKTFKRNLKKTFEWEKKLWKAIILQKTFKRDIKELLFEWKKTLENYYSEKKKTITWIKQ